MVASLLLMLPGVPARAAQSGDSKGSGKNYLLVSDPGPKKVYFYKVPDMKLTGTLDDVGLGSVHGGTIVLSDGRILMGDVGAQRILAVRLDSHGRPSIQNSVPADLGAEAPWSAVDPGFSYYALASNHGTGSTGETVNLVNLKTFKNTKVAVPATAEDAHPFLAGSPLTLFISLGPKIDAFKVADLVNGKMEPTDTIENDTGLHHGNWISPATKKLGLTADAGLDVIKYSCSKTSCGFGDHVNVPWNVDGFTGPARAFRPRVLQDGTHVGNPVYISSLADPTTWPDNPLDFHVTDLKGDTARRVNVGKGQTARGYGLSKSLALFSLVHPNDTTPDDQLVLLDVRPGSPKYLKAVGDVKLPHMTNGPVSGQPTTDFATRFISITPDGRYAFATAGGDGKIFVVDTSNLKVKSVSTPTALQTNAYLNAFQVGLTPVDLMGR